MELLALLKSPGIYLGMDIPFISLVGIIALLVVLWLSTRESEQHKKTKDIAISLAPWYYPSILDLIPLLLSEDGLASYIRKRRKELGCFTFRMDILDFFSKSSSLREGPTILLSHVEDIVKVYSQQRKLDLAVALPETTVLIHGKGSIQELSGSKHAFYRKLFSSLLSPRALEGFLPHILADFGQLWSQLDDTVRGKQEQVILRDHIRRAQFFLMAKILYGVQCATPDCPDRELAERLQANFELEDAALFAAKKSKTFQEGLEASKDSRRILWERFQKVLQDAKTNPSNAAAEEEVPVGNAFQAIAQALVETGKADDPETLQDVQDNILLLLEASHGTTMHVTTSLLYFLNHPDNRDCLQKVRQEVQALEGTTPTLTDIKHNLPYADACINETNRMAPIIGGVNLHMPQGKSVTLPSTGQTLEGPAHLWLQSSNWYMDSDVFPQPKRFAPERWLETEDPLQVTDLAKRAFHPFGGGAHVCLGQSLARIVLKANLYCFAKDTSRSLTFDVQKVKPVLGIFPEKSIRDGLPCFVE